MRAPRTAVHVGTTAAPVAPKARAASAAPVAAPASSGKRAPLASDRVQLIGNGGRALQVGVRTEVGKHLVRQFGSDAEFWDAHQCVLERRPDRRWQIVPVAGAANETLLNGELLIAPQVLYEGDVIAVGRKAAGIVKLPLTVSGLAG